MKLNIYSVFDNAVKAYMPIFLSRAHGEAVRSFAEAVNDPQKPFGKYSTDYTLYYLGQWDDVEGMIYPLPHPEKMLSANTVLSADDVQLKAAE